MDKPVAEFWMRPSGAFRGACKVCENTRHLAWAADNPVTQWALHALTGARKRARKGGLPFALTLPALVTSAPAVCPVMGLELDYGKKPIRMPYPNSPTVDRLRPSMGYTPSNIAIISHRANTLKSNATPAELRCVADWFERQLHDTIH